MASQVHRGGAADSKIQHSPRLQDPGSGESAGRVQHRVLGDERCLAQPSVWPLAGQRDVEDVVCPHPRTSG